MIQNCNLVLEIALGLGLYNVRNQILICLKSMRNQRIFIFLMLVREKKDFQRVKIYFILILLWRFLTLYNIC